MAIEKTLLQAVSTDRALGSSILFDHRHPDRTPEFHVGVIDAWRSADEMVLIETFRGGAKTTLAEEFLLMEGCYGNFFYCVLFGETYDKACQKLEAMAYEGSRNAKIHTLFGSKVLARKPVENKIWFKSGSLIEAFGWEQEITGMKYLDHRPDRAYLDDVENLERVRDTGAVDATVRKVYRELWPAMDKQRRKIRVTQTPRAADCMVTRFRGDPSWVVKSYPICDGDIDDPATRATWPERYPMEWIREERDKFERAGQLREFMQEFMLQAASEQTKPFAEEDLRGMEQAPTSWMPKYAIWDPARTASAERSDRTGKVVVSRYGGKILVHESSGKFLKPDEIRTDVFETQERHGAIVGIEKNSLDEHLMQPIRMEMIRRGVTFGLKPLQAPQDRSILNFPAGKLDILNALAYCLRMFAGTPVYEDFSDANVGEAPPRPRKVFASWNANGAEAVCVVVVSEGRHWTVCADYAALGPPSDAVKTIAAQLRAGFPGAAVETYVPAEIHDQWQRIPLVPALRALKYTPWRGEHVGVARGGLADAIRTEMRRRRLLTVSPAARNTITALAGEYKYPMHGGKQQTEPESGLPRLNAEALETLTSAVIKVNNAGPAVTTNAVNSTGTRYLSALPGR
jgi:hypothetical protein